MGISFNLTNGVTAHQAKNSSYYVYALEVGGELYIGFTGDPYSRVREHVASSRNELSRGYTTVLSKSIREHIETIRSIIAVSECENEARCIEASAIEYFNSSLNIRPEYSGVQREFTLKPENAVELGEGKRAKTNAWFVGHSPSQRKTILATVTYNGGRKRILADDGNYVECSRPAREELTIGAKVKLNARWSDKKGCWVAGKDTHIGYA